ncbi:MAG TPA: L,D-transpeptidase [Paracoccaceae bacterium]|nr:L,D-transpeptidase [Paracoccaceae bacterium]
MRKTAFVCLLFFSLAACAAQSPAPVLTGVEPPAEAAPVVQSVTMTAPMPVPEEDLAAWYAARQDGGHLVPAIEIAAFDRAFLRQRLPYPSAEAPGTIIVDTAARHLYLVEDGGWATRYGIAIGRLGFGWTGTGTIERRLRWPVWTPPRAMIGRDPSLARWRRGMPGSARNPLGARALYIYFDGADSQYRIHGTNDPMSVGQAASSGCFRMLNQDVIDLYERVELGATVIVL